MDFRREYANFTRGLDTKSIESKIEGVFLKLKLSESLVGNQIQFSSKSKIVNANIKYKDNYGHETLSAAKSVVQNGENVVLTFDYFYMNEYELEVNGYDFSNNTIENISVVQIDQTQFKESKDSPHGHLLDNSKMTITSNKNHEGGNVIKNALNSDVHSIFQSESYTNEGYGEVVVKTGTICLIDQFKFFSTIYDTKVLNNYTISYRSSENDDWKEIVNVGNNRSQTQNHIFKPVLATEFRIIVTKSTDNKIFLASIDIVKYSTIRTEILDLFTSTSLRRLASGVTQENIIALKERATFTEDYMRMLDIASDLIIDRDFIAPKVLKLDLKEITLINHIAFTNDRNILKGVIKYKDVAGNVCGRRLFWYPEDVINGVVRIGVEHPIIGKMRVLSKEVEILIYGADNVEFVEYKSLPLDGAFLTEEKDSEIEVKKCFLDGTHVEPLMALYEDTPIYGWCDPCYPGGAPRPIIDPLENNLLRLGDKNVDQYYRTSDFTSSGCADIKVFLPKEMFVGEVDLMSFFAGEIGHVNRFEILAEDIAASRLSWDENTHERHLVSLGFGERKNETNEYMITKLKPYYTDKIIVRIHDAKDNKARVNELRVFQYTTLDTEVDALFNDATYTSLKAGVTLETVRGLEVRALENGRFTKRLETAKTLLAGGTVTDSLESVAKNLTVEVPVDGVKVFNKIQISADNLPTSVEVVYSDALGVERRKVCDFVIEYFKSNSFVVLHLPVLCATKLEVVVNGVSAVNSINVNDMNFEAFLGEDSKVDLKRANLVSTHGKFNNLENLRDTSMTSYYTSDFFTDLGYTDVVLKFADLFLIDSMKVLSYRSKASGLVRQFKLLVKEPLTGELVELGDSGYSAKYVNSHREVKAVAPYLTNEVVLRVTEAENDWAIVNDVEIHKLTKNNF
ncbi:hypothetical protein [Cetobacterium sp.]|uniref:hypothetical protein n=1 Tax=Cetobacterium sp. TaxID=2071632 RepID=UPI003F2CAED1